MAKRRGALRRELTAEQYATIRVATELELCRRAVRAARAEDWRTLRALETLRPLPIVEERPELEPMHWDEVLRFAMPPGEQRPPYRERPCPHCVSGRLGAACVVHVEDGVERWGHPWTMSDPGASDWTPERIARGALIQGAFFCSPPSGPHPIRSERRC